MKKLCRTKFPIFATCMLIILSLPACTGVAGITRETATPTIDIHLIQTETAKAQLQQTATQMAELTALAVKTAEAVQTADAQATLDDQATQNAQATLSVQETATARVLIVGATVTQYAMNVQSTKVAATAHAQPILDTVLRLYDDGAITSTEGQLFEIDDFDESWAQINWYRWWETGLTPKRFVVSTHMEWDSASKTANWFNSGCGFVFAAKDDQNHYLVYLGLDGYVRIARLANDSWGQLADTYYGKLPVPVGGADVILAVEDDLITVYVNDVEAAHAHDDHAHRGPLGLTLMSGTNKDYGTRCQMTDIHVWILR